MAIAARLPLKIRLNYLIFSLHSHPSEITIATYLDRLGRHVFNCYTEFSFPVTLVMAGD